MVTPMAEVNLKKSWAVVPLPDSKLAVVTALLAVGLALSLVINGVVAVARSQQAVGSSSSSLAIRKVCHDQFYLLCCASAGISVGIWSVCRQHVHKQYLWLCSVSCCLLCCMCWCAGMLHLPAIGTEGSIGHVMWHT